ncbi:FtsX-like permease family protein [Flammeovirgaceae bacterium SG7u.111]|nr:FtsX-like permease family protein [Flammeovirgaceae bacterium SG7u.132]WPO34015.1 FtsX-like permease family protein [Flammeovirgaceae bacterium SG7u.111]
MSIKMNVLLKEGTDYEKVNKKLSGFIAHHIDEEKSTEVFLQPYKDVHLYQQFSKGRKARGRIAYVRLFSIVAIFILIIGCINFMNLSTAKAGNRAKEVGIRKVVGAKKRSLMGQFLGESMFITFIAMLLAVAFVEVFRPTFNQLTNKEIEIPYFNSEFLLFVLIISLITSTLSGSYPAVFLSSFVPVKVLKGTFKLGAGGDWVRRSLVVFQFVLSSTLITCTLLIHDQISFIQTKNLGMDRENVLYFGINEGISKHDVAFMNEFKQLPGITQAAYAGEIPLSVGN